MTGVTICVVLGVLKSLVYTDAAFTYTPGPSATRLCDGTDANLTWIFDNPAAQTLVLWTVNGTTIARLLGSNFLEGTGYNGRLQHNGNGRLIINSVTTADSGNYRCVVSYNDGTPQAINETTVNVYGILNSPVEIKEEKEVSKSTLSSSLVDSSISYTWISPYNPQNATGSSLTVTKNGLYTLCISGGRAACLNQTLSNCISYEVSLLACTGSFHCGFWLLLLAVVTSIIILILMWRKVKRFGFSASGFSKMKIGITGVFSFVAVGIGLGLGFGLQAGQANCLECGATIGISIALGVALSVIQFIVIINCDKEKGCDGNSKGETDRSNGDRARTPASATGINLETKKN